jgi:DUF1680 family protein
MSQLEKQTNLEQIEKDLNDIYIGNLGTVDVDLTLPQKGKRGTIFTWKSGEILFLSDDGKITRPTYGVGNRTVSLIVTASLGNLQKQKVYDVTILEEQSKTKIIQIHQVNVNEIKGKVPKLPSFVIVVLDDHTTSVTRVTWIGVEELDLFSTNKQRIIGHGENTDLTATCEITFMDSLKENQKTFDKTLIQPMATKLHISLLNNTQFFDSQNRMLIYLLSVNDDQMLYNFREAAGLDSKEAPSMTGWDAPDSNLKGHTTGHYLSSLALGYKSTQEKRLKEKITYMIEELAKCQEAMFSDKGYSKGFLSAYSEQQFDLLEKFTTYPTIWAPYYTLDKIMSGLLDCYVYADDNQALEICTQMGNWVYERLNKLNRNQLNTMWSIYIAGEFGGMTSTMVRLFQLTQKKENLNAAVLFENDKLFYPMSQNVDTLKDMHANQHIPQIIGALDLFISTGNMCYYSIANNFWKMVTNHHIYSIGGTGETEMFKEKDEIASFLTSKTAESCASYNMLKLTSKLFSIEPNSFYMDYYEKTLYNHILSSGSHKCNGGTTYFMPLIPAGQKSFDTIENTCCHGTGLENSFRFQDDIYSASIDRMYINLYIPSSVKWLEKNIMLVQEGNLLNDNITISISGSGKFDLLIRKPEWSDSISIFVNSEKINPINVNNGYVSIDRQWSDNDKIEVILNCCFKLIKANDCPDIVSLAYGPIILAALNDSSDYLSFNFEENELDNKISKKENQLEFLLDGQLFVPLNSIEHQKYHVYFKLK